MTKAEAMHKIESDGFSAVVNLASSLKTFLRIVADQPEIQSLSREMNSSKVTAEVFRRTMDLVMSPAEAEFEHPADAAIAAYIWLISNQDQKYAEIAAETVLDCPQFWWARKVADEIRSASRFHSNAGLVSRVLPSQVPGVDYTAHADANVFSIQSMQQLSGRGARAPQQPQASESFLLVQVDQGDLSDLFKSHDVGSNRIADLVAER
jgi:hypothetical protein